MAPSSIEALQKLALWLTPRYGLRSAKMPFYCRGDRIPKFEFRSLLKEVQRALWGQIFDLYYNQNQYYFIGCLFLRSLGQRLCLKNGGFYLCKSLWQKECSCQSQSSFDFESVMWGHLQRWVQNFAHLSWHWPCLGRSIMRKGKLFLNLRQFDWKYAASSL